MRERWALQIALATGLVVLVVVVMVALTMNREPPHRTDRIPVAPAASSPADPLRIARGRVLYAELRCAACHAIAGEGNPRSPLDDAARRLDAASLRRWIIADPGIEAGLPNRARIMKADYRALPEADLDALVVYLQSLGSPDY